MAGAPCGSGSGLSGISTRRCKLAQCQRTRPQRTCFPPKLTTSVLARVMAVGVGTQLEGQVLRPASQLPSVGGAQSGFARGGLGGGSSGAFIPPAWGPASPPKHLQSATHGRDEGLWVTCRSLWEALTMRQQACGLHQSLAETQWMLRRLEAPLHRGRGLCWEAKGCSVTPERAPRGGFNVGPE